MNTIQCVNLSSSAFVQFYTVFGPPVLMTDPALVPLCFWPLKGKNLAAIMRGWHCPSQAGHKNIDTEGWSVIFVCLTFEKSTGAIAEVINKYQVPSLGARRAKLTTSSGFVAAQWMASDGRAAKVKLRMALAHGAMQAL